MLGEEESPFVSSRTGELDVHRMRVNMFNTDFDSCKDKTLNNIAKL